MSDASTASLVSYLQANRGTATYLVAAFGSHSSASIIIESGEPVMTIGGFNGADPAPTLEEFQQLVASGQVRYLLVTSNGMGGMTGAPPAGMDGMGVPPSMGGEPPAGVVPTGGPGAGADGATGRPADAEGGGGPGANATSAAIATWAKANGTVVPAADYGGTSTATLYDLGS